MGALWLAASSGCQLLMEDIHSPRSEEGGVNDATAHNDADVDASIIPSDAGSTDAADDATQLDAQQEPDGAPADADAAPVDTSLPPPDPLACDGAGSQVFFEDRDEDGYGDSSSFMIGCQAPVGYVGVNEDCNDDNDAVHPGQTEFFGDGYPVPGSNLISFDYDCDLEEVAQPGQELASPEGCEGLVPCTGAGYVATGTRRDVPRANGFCGSRSILSCGLGVLICTGTENPTDTPYACH